MADKNMIPSSRRPSAPYNPLERMSSMVESLDRSLESIWPTDWFRGLDTPSLLGGIQPWGNPEIHMEETPKEFIVSMALPGMDKKDVQVEAMEESVIIKAEQRMSKKNKSSYSSFTRSFSLPKPVKSDQAKASFKDGMLRIELPKIKESQINRIPVQ